MNDNAYRTSVLTDRLEISVTCAPTSGNDALRQARQILLSAFLAGGCAPQTDRLIHYPTQEFSHHRTFDDSAPKCNTKFEGNPMAP